MTRTTRLLSGAVAVGLLISGSASAVADPRPSPSGGPATTTTVPVMCDGIGQDVVTVTGDLGDGGSAQIKGGPLTIVGEPGFTGQDAAGDPVKVAPTGEGVRCTAERKESAPVETLLTDGQAPDGVGDETLTGRRSFTVDVDVDEVLAAAPAPQATALSAASGPKRLPFESTIRSYLNSRPGAVGVAVRVPGSGQTWTYTKSSARNITASIVKVQIMAGIMMRAQAAGRPLNSWERSKIRPMIRNSDNAATTALFKSLGGRAGLDRAAERLGMTSTYADRAGHWGLTSTVPGDQVLLMEHFMRATGKLSPTNRSFGMVELLHVSSSQDWGITAGPPDADAPVKNGWLPRADGWHVNSIGGSQAGGYDYTIAVLTHHNPGSMSGQISTIEGVSTRIWNRRTALYEDVANDRITRVGGTDTYDTAARLSRANYSPGLDTVYLAASSATADRLAAAPWAGATRGPVLLATKSHLPSSTAAELTRLRPRKVVIVGNTATLSNAVAGAATRAAGSTWNERVGGATRWGTAAAMSSKHLPAASRRTVVVANGDTLRDALAVGPAATRLRAPVLLSGATSVPAETLAEIRRIKPARVVMVGGTAALSSSVRATLRQAAGGATLERWAGKDQYETASICARHVASPTADQVLIANASSASDALTAAPLAARKGVPLLLTASNSAPAATSAALRRIGPDRAILLGTTGVVSPYGSYLLSRQMG